MQSITYSILTSSFASRREQIIGYAETAGGCGLLIGPIIGEFIFNQMGGYFPAFLFFGTFLGLAGLSNLLLLPSTLNRKPVITNEEFEELEKSAPVQVQNSWFYKNRRVLFISASLTMQSYFVNFKQSFMTTSLVDTGKVSQPNLGKTLSLQALFYIISCNIVARIINRAPKRVFILLCFIMIPISNLLMGPSDALGLEKYFIPLFFIGQGLNGFSQGFLFTPTLPEIIDAVYAKQKLIEGEDEVVDAIISDRASGIYGLFYAGGTISAPLVGSFVYESLLNKNWA